MAFPDSRSAPVLITSAQAVAAELVGAPDDHREDEEHAQLGRMQRRSAEEVLERRQIDQRGEEGDLAGDPQSRSLLVKNPTDRSEARSVPAASVVPISHATMPANVMVVARR